MANENKRNRRMQLDKDPNAQTVSTDTTSGIPSQPIPGMPQGAGNMMNNPQVAQSMGGGRPQPGGLDPNNPRSPYGDPVFTQDQLAQTGSIGFTQNSGNNQNFVPGRRLNSQAYNSVMQPEEGSMNMLLPQGLAKGATERAHLLYAAGSGDPTPSYKVGPLGMMGTPIESQLGGEVNPGQMMPTMSGQTNTTMPLQGNNTQTLSMGNTNSLGPENTGNLGMNTGRGGGRNQLA